MQPSTRPLSRTILTSLTVFIVVLILYAVGGEGIHGFAFALVVGVVAGSYSTIYIATPIVLWMNRSEEASNCTRQAHRTGRSSTDTSACLGLLDRRPFQRWVANVSPASGEISGRPQVSVLVTKAIRAIRDRDAFVADRQDDAESCRPGQCRWTSRQRTCRSRGQTALR